MKKYLVFASALIIASLSMQSCNDFTDPGEELGAGQVTTNTTTLQSGKIDTINYKFIPTEEGVKSAINELNEGYYLQTIPSGTYCIRGGKIQDGVVYKPA
ncbi:MAG: hypothetical protein II249_05495, partial [Bacteroidaceae bacterium]|nr:hypothetical protein [Bacteroidaceae bacterium]